MKRYSFLLFYKRLFLPVRHVAAVRRSPQTRATTAPSSLPHERCETRLPAASLGRTTRATPGSGQEVKRRPWKWANRRRAGGVADGSYPQLSSSNAREKLLGGGAVFTTGRAGFFGPKLSKLGNGVVGAFVAVRSEAGLLFLGGTCFCSALYREQRRHI